MTPEQTAAIERLRELEAKATQGNWYKAEEFEQSLTALCRAENREDILFGACDWEDADLIVALRNEALPLIEALAAENERLRQSHDKTHQMIDRIHAALDYEQTGFSTVDIANDLLNMKEQIIGILDDEPPPELFQKTQQLEAERDALQARIDGALGVIESLYKSVILEAEEIEQIAKAIEILKGEQNV